ncbi:hypothetical protein ACLOJK_018153 [Asimina triloba]
MTDEYVRSFIDFQEIHYAEGIAAGAHVSGFTDWRHLGHSGVDFGVGVRSRRFKSELEAGFKASLRETELQRRGV